MTAPLRVVVPAHVTDATNLGDLERCVQSVLRHAPGTSAAFELLVIDDASPHGEVATLVDALEPPAGVGVSFVHHAENRGFVATANEGFQSTDGDVVILNSDTVVTDGWLDRLAEAGGGASVATVTPLTNAGSICTVPPHLCAPFDLESDEPRIDACAELVARHSLALRPEVISGVGFCMFVSRAALDVVGGFDEETFGRGYGEEVDFCLRASAAGFHHLVEDSTFVFHRGGGSFGATREAAMAQASTLLRQRHPGFKVRNRRERANDPLAPVFANLEAAVAPRDPARPHVLHLLHQPSPYGGTERHLAVMNDALRDEVDASVLSPSEEGFVLRSEWRDTHGRDHVATRLLPGRSADATADTEVSPSALRITRDLFDLTAVHVHNLIGHPLDTLAELDDFPGPVICSVHDLYLACPNHSLLYRGTVSCGIPDDLDVCDGCMTETRGQGRADLEAHRATVRAGLGAVDGWITFSRAAADHLLRAYPIPEERLSILPHGSLVPLSHPPLDERRLLDAPLQIAFVGRGWAKKGLDLVNRAAEDLSGNAGVHLHHFGDLRDGLSEHVTGHGPYDSADLPALLHEAGIGVVLLPGPYAETYGFVMSEALHAGLPVIGPYYGAIGERIRTHDAGWTIDPDDPDSLSTLLHDLERCRIEVLRATRRARSVQLDEVARSALGYRDLYRSGVDRPETRRADDETPV